MQTNNTGLKDDLFGEKGHQTVQKFLANLDLPDVEDTLTYANFCLICNTLFPWNEIEQDDWRIRSIFNLFDRDKDGLLKGHEWKIFSKWLHTTLDPVFALLIVDVQNDFIDGTLKLRACSSNQDGFDVVEPINRLTKHGLFDKVIYSMDWHPENHISFYENLHLRELHPHSKVTKENAKLFDTVIFSKPYLEQILWPKHCVAHTWGAQLHKDLVIAPGSKQVLKGTNSEEEAYSVFSVKDSAGVIKLEEILRESGVTQLFVCGLAYDVCVKSTSLEGLQLGYSVAVIDDCSRGTNLENIAATKRLIVESGGLIVDSDKVLSLINAKERSLIMSHQSAKKITGNSYLESTMIKADNE